MCYSNSSTTANVDLSKKYGKKIPHDMPETPVFFASGFSFPAWRIVTSEDALMMMNWGLIPSWFRDSDPKEIASITLNARVETIGEKASFRNLVHRQHCIIPSSGFFEWKSIGKDKIPYFIRPAEGPIFSMAGLYDQWNDPVIGRLKTTFTILTCPANSLMEEIHNSKKRMPVLLLPEQENNWLRGSIDPHDLEKPVESAFIRAIEIDRRITSGKHPNCPEVQNEFKNPLYEQGSLF
ncbi:MAG: SOS response-associated peptidase [Flavobacteriales bacterium]